MFTWRYVEKYDFYDIRYVVDDYAFTRIYVNSHRLQGLDMPVPDAIAYLLRAEMACEPERRIEKKPIDT